MDGAGMEEEGGWVGTGGENISLLTAETEGSEGEGVYSPGVPAPIEPPGMEDISSFRTSCLVSEKGVGGKGFELKSLNGGGL